jgi:superfamily II DNA or RNA helicase
MLEMPTGAGKTLTAAHIIDRALSKDNRVIFSVPAISLIDQTVTAFWEEGIRDVGVIQSQHPLTDYSKPVQVASMQTLMNRQIPHADIVIVDEAHRWFEFTGEWMNSWNLIPFVGLSATPWTRGLGRWYDDLLQPTSIQELIDAGHLCDFKVYAPSHPDMKGVRTVAGDYHEGDLQKAMAPLVADAVTTWINRAEDRPTICFAVDRVHARMLCDDFLANGVRAEYADAYTDTDEREEIRKRFHSGETQVVCNVGILTTGVDWDVRCISLCRPTKSAMLFTQIIGRGLRTAPGKDHCLILDHSDTHLRLGFVTDIHHDHLDDGSKEKVERQEQERLPSECPKCQFVKPVGAPECPACGFKPTPRTAAATEDGTLEELERMTKTQRKHNRDMTPAQKEQFYGELKYHAETKGYSPGWAAHKYKSRLGVFPNHYKDAAPTPPSAETLNYIKHLNIRAAKGRARRAA